METQIRKGVLKPVAAAPSIAPGATLSHMAGEMLKIGGADKTVWVCKQKRADSDDGARP